MIPDGSGVSRTNGEPKTLYEFQGQPYYWQSPRGCPFTYQKEGTYRLWNRYLAYRAKMDDISKQRMQAQALNEADVLRGDKIRRDVRNHGLPGHRRR